MGFVCLTFVESPDVGRGMKQEGIIGANKPRRAGQESYLDPGYIFQGTEREKKMKFLAFNYRAAAAQGTLSTAVLRPTA